MDNLIDMEHEFKEKVLLDEIDRLKGEITRLRIALKETGADEDVSDITDEEILIVNQISRLKDSALDRELDTDEVKRFDLLHKNLKMIRTNHRNRKVDRTKNISTEDLMKELQK